MNFKEYSFRDLLSCIVDNRGRTCPTAEEGTPLIATNCIKNTGLYPVYEKLRYVSDDTYNSWFRGHPQPGDMIFVCKGSPGRVCWVPDPVSFCIAQDMVAIRPDETKVYPKYLFALLRSEAVQNKIINMHVGTLIPHFKKGDFANLYLDIPDDMDYQRQVGDAYFAFCEKLENNHQINQTLEQIAQAIFKSWFVDFEPVKAKIAARERWYALQVGNEPASPVCYAGELEDQSIDVDLDTYMNLAAVQAISGKDAEQLVQMQVDQPEEYAELYTTAELFPSSMQDSELGEIPGGWEAGSLSDVADLNKNSWSKKTMPKELLYVDLSNTNQGLIEVITKYTASEAPSRARRRLFDGDTIVGTVRPGNKSYSFIKAPESNLTGSTGFAVMSPKTPEYAEFIYLVSTSDESIAHLAHLADGGAYPAVRPDVVVGLRCIIPDQNTMLAFHQLITANFTLRNELLKENSGLALCRDTLLPKLLSGELIPENLSGDAE